MSKSEWRKRLRLELLEREINRAEIARRLGVTPGAVYHVTSGRKRIARIIEALVAAGMPAEYFEDGQEEKEEAAA